MLKLKPSLSERNPFWLSKHRFYELKHFCLQYPEWKAMYISLGDKVNSKSLVKVTKEKRFDLYFESSAIRADLKRNMELVESTCRQLEPGMREFIFKAVTDGTSYTTLKTRYDIPCGKDLFYSYIRKFYYLLSIEKGL